MKKIVFFCLIFIIMNFFTSCTYNEKFESSDLTEQEFSQLTNYYEDYKNYGYTDKFGSINERKGNEEFTYYLINYGIDEKYFCGYIPKDIYRKVENYINFISKENNRSYDISNYYTLFNLLKELRIEFSYKDIIWKVTDSLENISLNYEYNYTLSFICKAIGVDVIENLGGEHLNVKVYDYLMTTFTKDSDNIVVGNNIYQLDNGYYFIYGHNQDSFTNISFNDIVINISKHHPVFRYLYTKVEYTTKYLVIENSLNEYLDNYLSNKYGKYAEQFLKHIEEEILLDEENIIVKFDYLNYRNVMNEISNENDEIDFLLNEDVTIISFSDETQQSALIYKIEVTHANYYNFKINSNSNIRIEIINDQTNSTEIIGENTKIDFNYYMECGYYYLLIIDIVANNDIKANIEVSLHKHTNTNNYIDSSYHISKCTYCGFEVYQEHIFENAECVLCLSNKEK